MGDIDSDGRDVRQRLRRAPGTTLQIVLSFASEGRLPDDNGLGPVELTIEATNADRDLAGWCDDDWWTEMIVRWADRPVTVRLSPTPGAMLHPVILYQLEMLRRVTPNWRLVGYGYRDDVVTDGEVMTIARSGYHEVRFIDEPRPDLRASNRFGSPLRLDELFGRVRRAQAQLGMTTPVLVRLPSVQRVTGSEGFGTTVVRAVSAFATPRS